MPKYANLDHYLDPDTGILKNKLGIRDAATLETAEADYVAARSYELAQTQHCCHEGQSNNKG
jgi:fido (protein-threonine AMPylation protein)